MKSDYVKVLVPSYLELLVYLSLSLMLLFGSVLLGISNQYREETAGEVSLEQTIGVRIDDFVNQSGGEELVATLSLAIFWSGIGGLVYLLITIAGNLLQSQIDDVTDAKSFVRPGIINHENHWLSLAERALIRLNALLAVLGLLVVSGFVTAPLLSGFFSLFMANLNNLGSIFSGLLAVVVAMINLHLFVVLLRIAFMRTRLFVGND